ncbi:MAG TPA: J domain-containing protein [Candidatus Limnocylindria bacterium]|nr:J domain-containing protein [Candidatus Limnocylindria bacterium]
MAKIDPYATLGVPRTASRDEIARAYRRLAKRYHPDAGATPTGTMSRINEAWHILSDPNRRAEWDRLHPPITGPRWTATDRVTVVAPAAGRRASVPRPPAPPTPTTFRDSPWMAVLAMAIGLLLLGTGVVIGAVIGGSTKATQTATFATDGLRMDVPDDWRVVPGDGDAPGAPQRVVAHVVTFPVTDDELCTAFGRPCALADARIPVGEASIVITAFSEGTPPVPEPVRDLPGGLEADRLIGGQPAAFELRGGANGYLAWWQLSPPGFPDEWIEVTARVGGRNQDAAQAMLSAVDAMVESVEFQARAAD